MYTDGLVEQRNEPLDDSIRRLLHSIDPAQPVTALVDHLLAAREADLSAAAVDDDVVIIALRARP
jgi:hypothetical protein